MQLLTKIFSCHDIANKLEFNLQLFTFRNVVISYHFNWTPTPKIKEVTHSTSYWKSILPLRLLILLPHSYISQVWQSENKIIPPSDLSHLRPYIPTYLSTPNLLKDFSYHTRVHTRSNSQHYPLPQLSFCLILLYIRYRSRSFISLSSSHTTLPTRRLQIQSIHILSVVLSCATT